MRKYVLLFIMLMPLSLMAQRIDLDKSWFQHTYRRLPGKILASDYMTYSVSVKKTVALDMYSNESASAMINIEGRQKVAGAAHFYVAIDLSDLIIESSQVKERVEVHKDKDGKETGRSYYYKVDVTYSFAAEAAVTDYKGTNLGLYPLAYRKDKKIYSTKEYSKSSDAANFYNNNKLEIKTQLISESISEALGSLNTKLNYDFGYKTMTSREYLWELGSKKHAEYAAYNEACEAAKVALQSMSNDAIPGDINDRLRVATDYFMNLIGKYNNADDKGEKKLRYGALYNLAMIYFYTEQYDLAVEYANKLIANDLDPKDGEKLIKETDELKESYQKHGIFTRHFHPDVENALPPQM